MKRFYVMGFGWDGYGTIEECIENNWGKYCNSIEDAREEYNRLWEEELAPDEGAFIYDVVDKVMIIED